MKNVGKLTDKQYDLLIACFKNGIPQETICGLTGLSWYRVTRERERWQLCKKIARLRVKESEPRQIKIPTTSSGRVFA